MIVTALYEYPVKGLLGNSICCATVNRRGLAMDRRWMLVDDEGNFISQRQIPALTQFVTSYHEQLIIKHKPSGEERSIGTNDFSELIEVTVWGQQCAARRSDSEINQWLSHFLEESVRLVYMDENDIRPVKSANDDGIVSFADGYPVLLTTQASHDDLNSKLDKSIKIDRFRPNILIDGDISFAEDNWTKIKIGAVTFKVAKTCARCHVINIDQASGMSTKEPLKTLSTYRKDGNKVNFGINLIPENTGIIHDVDEVTVLN